ncbi:hypothetical protein IMSAGC011_02455 [Lachnospiraceae bacterium]|nr:hypothetical protein IMSAGC011_02455 [Lachnospiraceae bacterium]
MAVIKEFAYELGKKIRCVEEIAAGYSKEEIQQMHKIGLQKIPTDNERMLQEMIQDVCKQITQRPDCILIAHSLPFICREGQQMQLCWSNVPTYYLSGMPCAIMHKAIEMASILVEKELYHSILVIGADKAYSDQERIFFGTIMGDGVVALLLEKGTGIHQILSSYVNTTILASDGENSSAQDIAAFRQVNTSFMRRAMEKCLEKAGLEKVDYYVTHTSNKEFWNSVSVLTKIPREIFLDSNIQNTGHMNSHDSFYHYFYWCEKDVILPGQTAMLINPGFGGSQGCTLLRR